MAEAVPLINASDIGNLIWGSLPPQLLGNINLLLTIAKVAGVLVLIYVVFLIIQAVIRTRQALRIKSIEQNVIEINQKLSTIIEGKHKTNSKKSKD